MKRQAFQQKPFHFFFQDQYYPEHILFACLTAECLRPARFAWGYSIMVSIASTWKPTHSTWTGSCVSPRSHREKRSSGHSDTWSKVILYLAGLQSCSELCAVSDWQWANDIIEIQLEKGKVENWGDSQFIGRRGGQGSSRKWGCSFLGIVGSHMSSLAGHMPGNLSIKRGTHPEPLSSRLLCTVEFWWLSA